MWWATWSVAVISEGKATAIHERDFPVNDEGVSRRGVYYKHLTAKNVAPYTQTY
jgi:hypothetical protein